MLVPCSTKNSLLWASSCLSNQVARNDTIGWTALAPTNSTFYGLKVPHATRVYTSFGCKGPNHEPSYIFGCFGHACSNSHQQVLADNQIDPIIPEELMNNQSTLNLSGALEGVHGVHVTPHSPFALEETNKDGDLLQSTSRSSAIEANQQLLMQWIWQHRPPCLRPIKGCIQGDQNLAETVANVLTSIPFVALGIQAPRKNLSTKLYANSLIGVGVASSLYHSSRGKLRQYLRWVDYTMIATATVCLSRALRDDNPRLLMAASAFLLPVRPLVVSAVHTGMMEVAFAKRASEDPDLRMAHNVHKVSSLLGGVLFIADDVFPRTPFIHAGWHLAAAVGVSACNKLLE